MRISDWSSDVCSSDLRRDCALWFGRWFLDSVPWPRGRRHGGSSRIPDRHVTAQRLFRQGQAIDCHWNMVSEFGHRPCPRFLHRRLDHRGFQLPLGVLPPGHPPPPPPPPPLPPPPPPPP